MHRSLFSWIAAALMVATIPNLSLASVQKSSPWSPEQHNCLALNVYHEARGEPLNGMIAVAQVVMNRVASDEEYPDDICGVISENRSAGRRCQFSWWCDGNPNTPTDEEAWEISQAIAGAVLESDELPAIVHDVRHYVRCDIQQSWLESMSFHSRIGKHCFYRDDNGEWEDADRAPEENLLHALFALVRDGGSGGLRLVHVPGDTVVSLNDQKDTADLVKENETFAGDFVDRSMDSELTMDEGRRRNLSSLVSKADREEMESLIAREIAPESEGQGDKSVQEPLWALVFDNRSFVAGWISQ